MTVGPATAAHTASRPYRAILLFAAPTSIETMAFTLVSAVDHYFVTFLSEDAAAAASLAAQVSFMTFLGFVALTVGAVVITGRLHGRGDLATFHAMSMRCIGRVGAISGAASLLLAVFAGPAMRAFGASDGIITAGAAFFALVALSLPFMVMSEAACRFIRNTGDARTPTLVGLSVLITNSVLNYICIFGLFGIPPVGLIGVALSTLVTRAAGFAILIYIFQRRATAAARDGKVTHSLSVEERKIARPAFLFELTRVASVLALTAIYTRVGAETLVAGQIVFTIETFFLTAMAGFCSASFYFLGQHLGRGDVPRAAADAGTILRVALALSLLLALAIAAAAALTPAIYAGLPDSTTGLASAGLVLAALLFPAKAAAIVLRNGILRAGGDMRYLLRVESLALVPGIAAAYVLALPLDMGLIGALAGAGATELAKLTGYMLRFRSPRWLVQIDLGS